MPPERVKKYPPTSWKVGPEKHVFGCKMGQLRSPEIPLGEDGEKRPAEAPVVRFARFGAGSLEKIETQVNNYKILKETALLL